MGIGDTTNALKSHTPLIPKCNLKQLTEALSDDALVYFGAVIDLLLTL